MMLKRLQLDGNVNLGFALFLCSRFCSTQVENLFEVVGDQLQQQQVCHQTHLQPLIRHVVTSASAHVKPAVTHSYLEDS